MGTLRVQTVEGNHDGPAPGVTMWRDLLTRTVGVEEEMFLVDPSTRHLTAVSDRVVRNSGDDAELEHELFLQQVESQTQPQLSLDTLLDELRVERRKASDAASGAGAAVVATGTPVLADVDGSPTPDERYNRMIDRHQQVGRQALVCATHVHVEVRDEEAVAVVDSLARWLPLLLALSANSPIDHGEDTGFASWRAHVWDGWPTAGPTEPFGDRERYDRSVQDLISTGAAVDEGMVYFDARIARNFPTVEVRVADICTDARDTVVIAGLARALVETAGTSSDPPTPMRVEMLRAARWRARRYGMTDSLVHPMTGRLVPAAEAVRSLLDHVTDALEADASRATVEEGVERIIREGTGSELQRRASESGGLTAVVDDLIQRTLA